MSRWSRLGVIVLALALVLGGCKKKEEPAASGTGPTSWGDEPTKAEPAKVEPTKTEPAKVEPIKPPQPTEPPPPPEPVVERSAGICAGSDHTCVMKASGEVLCTGTNLDGQLGDDTARDSELPVPVKGLADAVEIACGYDHTCARRADGSVMCWGQSYYGQLGNGSMEPAQVPVAVEGLAGVKRIAAKARTTCVVLESGTVRCWGDGSSGKLGREETTPSASPVEIAGLEGIAEVAVGPNTACARKESGEVLCWGRAGDQLGRGEEAGEGKTPAPVVNLTGAKHIAIGNDHACAATDKGVFCWGSNGSGQLGNGEKGSDKGSGTPVQVTDLAGVRQLALYWDRSCAVLESGEVSCWGNVGSSPKYVGVADDVTELEKAAQAKDLSDVTALALGSYHGCAVRKTGLVNCWGSGGAMGIKEWKSGEVLQLMTEDVSALTGETRERYSFEPSAEATLKPAPSVSAGNEFICAVQPDGHIACFGGGGGGVLGCGTTQSRGSANPCTVAGISDGVQVSATLTQACALRANGQVACWGDVGKITTSLPVPVAGLTDAVQIDVGGTAGWLAGCAVRADKTVACWADRPYVLLGQSPPDQLTAVPIPGVTDVEQIAVGYATACALRTNGKVTCWGDNTGAALGQALEEAPEEPVEVPRLSRVTHIAGNFQNFCAVHSGGKLSCWGPNDEGQIGNGQIGDDKVATSPTEVRGVRNAVASFVGVSATCAVLKNGEAMCWGDNAWNACGVDEESDNLPTAKPVLRGNDPTVAAWQPFLAVATGLRFGCALHADGNFSCWGDTPITPSDDLFGSTSTRSGFPVAAAGLQIVFPSEEPVATE